MSEAIPQEVNDLKDELRACKTCQDVDKIMDANHDTLERWKSKGGIWRLGRFHVRQLAAMQWKFLPK